MGFMNKLSKITGMSTENVPTAPTLYEEEIPQYPNAQPNPEIPSESPVSSAAPAMELKMVYPKEFNEVVAIARDLMGQRTIVMNTEQTPIEITRRMLDFLSGVAFCIGGQLQMIAAKTYIITPKNIDVSDEQFRVQQQQQMQQQQQAHQAQMQQLQQQIEQLQKQQQALANGFDPSAQN